MHSENGIVDILSNHSVDQTVDTLKSILQLKEITLFILIDHSGEAAKVGLEMRPTKLLIFGNPRAGTPPMLATPSIALDLPLKILVWEDSEGKVWLSYNSPDYLKERHGLPQDLVQNISAVKELVTNAAK
jgi:uncharacterized protein (DUF302 family)